MLSPEGVGVRVNGRAQSLRATPSASSVPDLWLLGSSDYSARLAAERGLPYVFAHHFSGRGTAEALELYRSSFRPSAACAEPRTFLTVNVCVAATRAEAERLALPQLLAMLALHTGAPLTAQRLVEEAEAVEVPEAHHVRARRDAPTLGDRRPRRRAGAVAELAATYGVDEVMVHPVAGAFAGTDPARAQPARRPCACSSGWVRRSTD